MSDNLYPETPWIHNMGVTQPGNANATHNGGLSPLFYGAVGRIRTTVQMFADRDYASNWSALVESAGVAYTLTRAQNTVSPSVNMSKTYAESLRCLVSTTNS